MKSVAAFMAVVAALVSATTAYGQSPANGAHFAANATIEFLAGDDLGEQHRLKIARDELLTDVVYDRADPYEIGQWFVVPQRHDMSPGPYYWQSCWVDFDSAAPACSEVRSLHITTPRIPRLSSRKAKYVVRQVYGDHGASWSFGNGKRYRCRRASRIRMRCRPSAWAGDTVVTAKLRMVNVLSGKTRVRGTITFFSEYCADVTPWRDCTDSERVSGRY